MDKVQENANLFEVSTTTIKKWRKEGYPFTGTLPERIRWVRENKPLANDKSLTEARREKIEVETELRKLELLIKQGELIPRSEVSSLFTDRIMVIRSGLINLHRILQPKLAGHDEREFGPIIKKEGMNLLERYSRRSGPLLKGGK